MGSVIDFVEGCLERVVETGSGSSCGRHMDRVRYRKLYGTNGRRSTPGNKSEIVRSDPGTGYPGKGSYRWSVIGW